MRLPRRWRSGCWPSSSARCPRSASTTSSWHPWARWWPDEHGGDRGPEPEADAGRDRHQAALQAAPPAGHSGQCTRLAEQAEREHQSYLAYLDVLLQAELEERERNTVARRLKAAH